ncbi:MAG: hypothetical protein ACFB14_06300 [Leptolyngbyaceae cyanobacterium]
MLLTLVHGHTWSFPVKETTACNRTWLKTALLIVGLREALLAPSQNRS